MRRSFLNLFVALSVATTFTISCERNNLPLDPSIDDNRIEGSVNMGIKSLKFSLPMFQKFTPFSDRSTVAVVLMGESDRTEYKMGAFLKEQDDSLSFDVVSSTLTSLPHQRYFLNFITYTNKPMVSKSVDDIAETIEVDSVSLGAILSLDDPNNIHFVSSFNAESGDVGIGTEEDPIPIATMDDFLQYLYNPLAELMQLEDVHYIQTRDINFASMNEYLSSWTPAGMYSVNNNGVRFQGSYNGGGFSIKSLNSQNKSSAGLFWTLGSSAEVKNLALVDIFISGREYVGAIACKMDHGATVHNVSVSGNIAGTQYVGGITGHGDGTIEQVSVTANIRILDEDEPAFAVGGIVGCSYAYPYHFVDSGEGYVYDEGDYYAKLHNCSYSGVIEEVFGNEENSCFGGIIGMANSIHLKSCAVSGEMITSANNTAGFIGYASKSLNVDGCVIPKLLMEDVVLGGMFPVNITQYVDYSTEQMQYYRRNFEMTMPKDYSKELGECRAGLIGKCEAQIDIEGRYLGDVYIEGVQYIGGVIGQFDYEGDYPVYLNVKNNKAILNIMQDEEYNSFGGVFGYIFTGEFDGYMSSRGEYVDFGGLILIKEYNSSQVKYAGLLAGKSVFGHFNNFNFTNTGYVVTRLDKTQPAFGFCDNSDFIDCDFTGCELPSQN